MFKFSYLFNLPNNWICFMTSGVLRVPIRVSSVTWVVHAVYVGNKNRKSMFESFWDRKMLLQQVRVTLLTNIQYKCCFHAYAIAFCITRFFRRTVNKWIFHLVLTAPRTLPQYIVRYIPINIISMFHVLFTIPVIVKAGKVHD